MRDDGATEKMRQQSAGLGASSGLTMAFVGPGGGGQGTRSHFSLAPTEGHRSPWSIWAGMWHRELLAAYPSSPLGDIHKQSCGVSARQC